MATDLLKSANPSYGGLCGVLIDPAAGDLLVTLSDRGVYRSRDEGMTWTALTNQGLITTRYSLAAAASKRRRGRSMGRRGP